VVNPTPEVRATRRVHPLDDDFLPVCSVQGDSNMNGTSAACLHTNQSRSYLNHLVFNCTVIFLGNIMLNDWMITCNELEMMWQEVVIA
jgi:hypothetical protein